MSLTNFIRNKLIDNIKLSPTRGQTEALNRLGAFIQDEDDAASCFILKGYAGTGKTTLIGALVSTLKELELNFALMAPTGRAAKVLSRTAKHFASTIHRSIYSVEDSNSGQPSFTLRYNTDPDTLFIVDEASMIAQRNDGTSTLFSQNLLADLVAFVKGAPGCKLLLVGDMAQLPPVGEQKSPALDLGTMAQHFDFVDESTLTEVVRQEAESGILHYATNIRNAIENNEIALPKFSTKRFPDFLQIPPADFLETVQSIYRENEEGETIILTRSNQRANRYNRLIRQNIFDCEEDLTPGDRLMICRNSYFWTKEIPSVPFLANGDIIRLKRIWNRTAKYGMRFADIEFSLEDYAENEITATCMLDVLAENAPALPREKAQELYRTVRLDLETEYGKRGVAQRIRKNEYLNALQLKHGYAVTCHKAQGGQWSTVLVDLELYPSIEASRELLRWIYTAITRATQRLYLIAAPRSILEKDSIEEF